MSWALLIAVTLSLHPGVQARPPRDAPAQPELLGRHLSWVAPAPCPQADFVIARVRTLTRNATPPRGLHFEFRIDPQPMTGVAGWSMAVIDDHAVGQRTIENADCEELAEAAAVMMALAIGIDATDVATTETATVSDLSADIEPAQPAAPSHADTRSVVQSSRQQTSPTNPAISSASPERRSLHQTRLHNPALQAHRVRPRPERARPRLALSSELLGIWRVIPGVWPATTIGVGLRGRRWALDARGTLLPWARVYTSASRSYGGVLMHASAELRACWSIVAQVVEWPVCAAFAGGMLRAQGVGRLAASRTQVAPWMGVVAGTGLRVPVKAIVLTTALDVVLTPIRARFVVEGEGPVCCSSTLGLRFGLGVEYRWPRRLVQRSRDRLGWRSARSAN